eukprot:Colp12_sorted_trinity150504_noHs@2814
MSLVVEGNSTGGVSTVEDDTACTADILGSVVTSASDAVMGIGVDTAALLLRGGAVETDVALLTPGGRPGVADEPVALAILLAIANQNNSVVKVRGSLVAAVEDTRLIRVPCTGIDGNGDGTNGGNGLHKSDVIVAGKLNIAGDGGGSLGVVDSALILSTVVRGVAVLVLRQETVASGNVIESELGSGSLALAGTAALAGVGGARGDLLDGEIEEETSVLGNVGLDHGSRCEGPARSATALVLDGGDDASLAPVNVLRELLDRGLHHLGLEEGRGVDGCGTSVKTERSLLLFGGHGRVLVDALLPRVTSGIVGLDTGKLGFEDLLTELVLLGVGGDAKVVVSDELVKGVIVQLPPVGPGKGTNGKQCQDEKMLQHVADFAM